MTPTCEESTSTIKANDFEKSKPQKNQFHIPQFQTINQLKRKPHPRIGTYDFSEEVKIIFEKKSEKNSYAVIIGTLLDKSEKNTTRRDAIAVCIR